MTMTETDRHHLLTALEGAIGPEAAMTLAAHLPPVGWADVATKRDLDRLAETIEHRFETIEHRFRADLHREIATVQRTLFFAILGAFAANAGLVLTVVERAI